MKNIKITIVTAVYNRVHTVEQTIKSVINQTYNNIEYIIIDGGSTDGTVDILEKYKDNFGYYCSEHDNGIYDAFNKGIIHATGDYIQFLSSDDCLTDPSVIGKVVEELNDGIDILSTCMFNILDGVNVQKQYSNELAKCKETFDWHMIPHPGMFVKTDLMKARLFDTRYEIAADFDFFLECYLNEKITFKYSSLNTVFFSFGGVSSTALDKVMIENICLYKKYRLVHMLDETMSFFSLKNKIIRKLRFGCKKMMILLGIYKLYLCRFKGWRKHCCCNEVCRWCGRINIV